MLQMPVSRPAGEPSRGAPGEGSPQPRAELLLALYRRVMRSLTRPAEVTRLQQSIVEESLALLRADGAALYLPEPDAPDIVRVRLGAGLLGALEGEVFPAEASFAGRVLATGEPQHTTNLATDRRSHGPREGGAGQGPALAAPLLAEGECLGSLLVVRAAGGSPFTPVELDLLLAAADVFAAALRNAAAFAQARGGREAVRAWRRTAELEGWAAAFETADAADGRVVFRWNLDSGAFQWSRTLPTVLGHEPGEFGTALSAWTERVSDDDRARVREEFARAFRDGEPLLVRCRMLHPSGAVRQVVLRTLLPADTPTGRQVVGVLEDVTDRERLALHRDQRARAGAVSEIIRALRHEINNPLSVVIGQIQLMQKDAAARGDESLLQSLRAIHEESARIHELVRRLSALEQYPREPFVKPSGGVNIPGEHGPLGEPTR